MVDFDEYDIVSPRGPIGIAFVVTPEEVEFALLTRGRSLQSRVLSALIAHLVVENDEDAPQQRLAKAG